MNKQTWIEIREFSRSCLIYHTPAVVSCSMRHSCWFSLLTALREHPSPSPRCHTHTNTVIVTCSLIGTRMKSHKQKGKVVSANPRHLESSSTWASRRATELQMCPVCNHQTCFLLSSETCGGHRTSNPITAHHYLLSLWRFPVGLWAQLVWTECVCVCFNSKQNPTPHHLQSRAEAKQWVSSECMLQLMKEVKWASQIHSYSTHSPAMTASVAPGTFPIHIHNNSKAHSPPGQRVYHQVTGGSFVHLYA